MASSRKTAAKKSGPKTPKPKFKPNPSNRKPSAGARSGAKRPTSPSAKASAPSYPPGSTISVTHLTLADVGSILAEASRLESMPAARRVRVCAKRRVALLFYEASTRTRTSFELAAKSLGADTVLVSALSSSIEKGESLKDTGITLRSLGAECIILRHPNSGAPYLLARATGLPILNAGDGIHEHPSQALLDLRTLLRYLGRGAGAARPAVDEHILRGVTITIVGDILHSRVARSNALLLPRFGANVIFSGPESLLPAEAAEIGPGVRIERSLDRALAESQAVMMLRIQRERLAGLHLDLDDYVRDYQLNSERLAAYAPDALVLHPGPMIRGLEIASEVADGPNSAVAEQVGHGVAIRMALLARALGAGPFKRGDSRSAKQ
jgi:aspartate carbamoyltransferase catalytic subunit